MMLKASLKQGVKNAISNKLQIIWSSTTVTQKFPRVVAWRQEEEIGFYGNTLNRQ